MKKIGVLISGGGTNLQALIDNVHQKSGEIVKVVSSSPDAYGLTRAENAGIPTEVAQPAGKSPEAYSAELAALMDGVDLVVLAGFMRILTKAFVEKFPNRIINIHPALIPSFCGPGCYGLKVHEKALAYGVKLTGATVHFVNETADGGPVIAQRAVAVLPGDTPERLQKRVMDEAEHILLPEVVRAFCEDRITVDGRTVEVKEEL